MVHKPLNKAGDFLGGNVALGGWGPLDLSLDVSSLAKKTSPKSMIGRFNKQFQLIGYSYAFNFNAGVKP